MLVAWYLRCIVGVWLGTGRNGSENVKDIFSYHAIMFSGIMDVDSRAFMVELLESGGWSRYTQ